MILEKWKVVYRQKTKVYRTTVRTNIYIYICIDNTLYCLADIYIYIPIQSHNFLEDAIDSPKIPPQNLYVQLLCGLTSLIFGQTYGHCSCILIYIRFWLVLCPIF